MDQLTIRTLQGDMRTFDVAPVLRQADGQAIGYTLQGARGAVYVAMRYVNSPEHLYVIDKAGRSPLGAVVLSDEPDGQLRQVR